MPVKYMQSFVEGHTPEPTELHSSGVSGVWVMGVAKLPSPAHFFYEKYSSLSKKYKLFECFCDVQEYEEP